jgi:streptomycin 6-kinase
VLLGAYGNALYRQRFHHAAQAAARHGGEYAAQLAVLTAAGGTDRRAIWLMIVAMAGVSAALVAFRQALDGVRIVL